MVRFLILGQYLTPFWGSKVTFSRNRQFFNLALVHFKNCKSQRHKTFISVFLVQFCTILRIVKVSWCNICGAQCPRKEQRHPIGKITWGQTGSMALIGMLVQRGTINMSMQNLLTYSVSGSQEINKNRIVCFRFVKISWIWIWNPRNRQISHYRYVWGKPRSVTSDDLFKAIM